MLVVFTPQVLMVRLGSQTSCNRLGSGGVMLPHYLALKVAEKFRLPSKRFWDPCFSGPHDNRSDGCALGPGNVP